MAYSCLFIWISTFLGFTCPSWTPDDDFAERVDHGFVDNDGVKIHFATLGEGPLMVMLHGFPDFWYTWRHQMDSLSEHYQTVAIDLRGYNESDKPKGVSNYAMPILINDVVSVIEHFGEEKAIVVGHDWGGAIAWQVAMNRPDVVERLIILNVPHPAGLSRELANNSEQIKNSSYARRFQEEGAHLSLSAEGLASWVTDESAKPKYIDAFKKSDFEAMLAYYKANFPKPSKSSGSSTKPPSLPKVKAPVLMIHGLDDKALLPKGLNDTWEWLEMDLTLVTIPGAGHFVQQDATDLVTRSMKMWLNR